MSRLTVHSIALCLLLALGSTVRADARQRRLEPGDRIQIVCDQDPVLCVVRRIGDDGAVEVPEIGPVGVATHTAGWAADRIEKLLIDSGTVEDVTIRVIPVYTKGDPIEVAGAVHHPMSLRFANGIDLASLLKSASVTDSADLADVSISHPDGSSEDVDATNRTFHLSDGDRVFVPQASVAQSLSVIGGVQSPSTIRYHRGITLKEAIDLAGGLAARANPDKVVVNRRGEQVPLSLPDDATFVIEPGESVQVGVVEDPKFVAVQGAVTNPGLVEFTSGLTVTKAIAAAGGVKKGAAAGTVVIRSVLHPEEKAVHLNLRFIYNLRIPDPVLSPDDVVEVRG